MTIQISVLEMRLGQMQSSAQRLRSRQLEPSGALPGNDSAWPDKPEVAAFRQSLDGLDAELRRALRQTDGLQRQLAGMEAALSAAPHDQRWREQTRIASFNDDLLRVLRRAARLASLLVELRRRDGGVSGVDLARAIRHIGTQMGKSLDQTMLLRTVNQVITQPAQVPLHTASNTAANTASNTASPNALGGLVETLFVVMAMVSALARPSVFLS